MSAPLHYRDVSTARLLDVLAEIGRRLPPRVYYAEIHHDDGCPCIGGRVPMERCSCKRVDVTVSEVQ